MLCRAHGWKTHFRARFSSEGDERLCNILQLSGIVRRWKVLPRKCAVPHDAVVYSAWLICNSSHGLCEPSSDVSSPQPKLPSVGRRFECSPNCTCSKAGSSGCPIMLSGETRVSLVRWESSARRIAVKRRVPGFLTILIDLQASAACFVEIKIPVPPTGGGTGIDFCRICKSRIFAAKKGPEHSYIIILAISDKKKH